MSKPSAHQAVVIPILLEPHPNAEKLSIVRANGNVVVVNTEDWIGVEKAVHVLPESIVDTNRKEFSWLGSERVRAVKLRGVVSYGLLVKCRVDAQIGEDLSDELGIRHWNPPTVEEELVKAPKVKGKPDGIAGGPSLVSPKYDLESLAKYNDNFIEGEPVMVTEKMEGENFRCVYSDGRFHVGSRTNWWAESESNHFWRAFLGPQNTALRSFLFAHPHLVVYGEIVGKVKGFPYGCNGNSQKVFVFDMLREGEWLDGEETLRLCRENAVLHAPVIEESIPFDYETVKTLADGNTHVEGADHILEGVVCRPVKNRRDEWGERVIYKCKSPTYLARKN